MALIGQCVIVYSEIAKTARVLFMAKLATICSTVAV